MAYKMTQPKASPDDFQSGADVTFSFKARGIGEPRTLEVTYSSDDVKLDGKKKQKVNRQIGTTNTAIDKIFKVTGKPGEWEVAVDTTDQDESESDIVLVNIET